MFRASELRTFDGQNVEILDPGRFLDGAGPDVRDAVIRLGSRTFSGDIEFHHNAAGWKQHEHHRKASYNTVILHVVLNSGKRQAETITSSGRTVPLLVLAPYLSSPVDTLWKEYLAHAKNASSLACFRKAKHIRRHDIVRWLRKVDVERLELKILRFRERLLELAVLSTRKLAEPEREYAAAKASEDSEIPEPFPQLSRASLANKRLWEQVLYESILEGLGYSRNRIPFVRLARIASLEVICSLGLQYSSSCLFAFVFGVSGLVPRLQSLKQEQSRTYVRMLVRHWNRFLTNAAFERMNPAEWQFSPTRPHNLPTHRISAVPGIAENILLRDMFRRCIHIMKSGETNNEKLKALRALFVLEPDEFWMHHYNFDRPSQRPNRVLGLSRVNDILANAIIPLSLLYARVFRDYSLREKIRALREEFPLLCDNSSTRAVTRELFYGKEVLTSLPLQQGAIQLYRYYCTKNRCDECEIGKQVFAGS